MGSHPAFLFRTAQTNKDDTRPRLAELARVGFGVDLIEGGDSHASSIAAGADLRSKSLPFLQENFGKAGAYFHDIARGIDHRPVRADRIRKSVGAENTFAQDLRDYEPMREALQPIVDKVWRHCEAHGTRGRRVTLKVKFSDFTILTRSRSLAAAVDSRDALEAIGLALLQAELPMRRSVRLLGLSLSFLSLPATPARPQMTFDV